MPNGELWANPKCGLNRWVKWIKQANEFMGAIWVFMWGKILKMSKYDHNVKLRCLGHNEVCMEWATDQWFLEESFSSSMREKKKTLSIGS